MAKYQTEVGTAVIGLAGFQLLQAWNANAPSLSDIRAAHPNDIATRQRLLDADFMIGGLSTVLGVAFAVVTGDLTALIVMLVMFGSISLWYHSVMNAEAR